MAKKKGPPSGIKSTYNKKKKELTIKFRNGTWKYEDVPVKTGRAMTNARSQGRFFNARIRDNYDGDNR